MFDKSFKETARLLCSPRSSLLSKGVICKGIKLAAKILCNIQEKLSAFSSKVLGRLSNLENISRVAPSNETGRTTLGTGDSEVILKSSKIRAAWHRKLNHNSVLIK